MSNRVIPQGVFIAAVQAGSRPEGVVEGLGMVTWKSYTSRDSAPQLGPADKRGLASDSTFFSQRYVAEITPIIEKNEIDGSYTLLKNYSKVQAASVVPLPMPGALPLPLPPGYGPQMPSITTYDISSWCEGLKAMLLTTGIITTSRWQSEYYTLKDVFLHGAGTPWDEKERLAREPDVYAELMGPYYRGGAAPNTPPSPNDNDQEPDRNRRGRNNRGSNNMEPSTTSKVLLVIGATVYVVKETLFPDGSIIDKDQAKKLKEQIRKDAKDFFNYKVD